MGAARRMPSDILTAQAAALLKALGSGVRSVETPQLGRVEYRRSMGDMIMALNLVNGQIVQQLTQAAPSRTDAAGDVLCADCGRAEILAWRGVGNEVNFVAPGNTITVLAPEAVVSGQLVLAGAMAGVASSDAALGAPVELSVEGIFDLAKTVGDALTAGSVAKAVIAGTGVIRLRLAHKTWAG